MDSKASIMGHPIHPMLVMFPLGLFPVALLFDVIWVVTGDVLWLTFASWLLAIGVVTTLVAMVPGFIDYRSTVRPHDAARPTATKHMITGLVTFAIFAVALLVRSLSGAWPAGADAADFSGAFVTGSILLNVLGNLALGVQGYLGGSLVYEHGVGVEESHAPHGHVERGHGGGGEL